VKGGVEHGHLGHNVQQAHGLADANEVGRVVQRASSTFSSMAAITSLTMSTDWRSARTVHHPVPHGGNLAHVCQHALSGSSRALHIHCMPRVVGNGTS
jgi:hypothetical protein